jgi:hypothetical protein
VLLPCPDQTQVGEAIMTKEAEALCIITNDQRGLPRASVSHGEPSIASSVLVFGPMEQMDTCTGYLKHPSKKEGLISSVIVLFGPYSMAREIMR